MKDRNYICFRKQIYGLLVLMFLAASFNASAQQEKEIGVTVYSGFTLVNFEKALDYSDEHMNDWDQFYYSVTAKGFLGADKMLQPGAEIGWQRLYYAYYVVPFGPSPVYREFNISTVSFTALARYSGNQRFYLSAGAGIHLFNDGVAPSVLIEPVYYLKNSEGLKIPLSLRLNPVFGAGIPTSVSLGIGLSYSLK